MDLEQEPMSNYELELAAELDKLTIDRNKSSKPNDFRLIKVVGRGGYGKVILARKNVDNKIYALKVINKPQNESNLQAVIDEIKVFKYDSIATRNQLVMQWQTIIELKSTPEVNPMSITCIPAYLLLQIIIFFI
ncbi:hypothetical protein L3Y34_010393 [Caenorhabditis briggsae]|uniref:Protein kinase domain-containing protein n=1 Tax=Caenorhabditis briggsae TaxID=6238 RepID=A0AAE8ZPW3_CAEBR|nr:hypothetical protein L3Y34_010393 [Caenorhabditis briggsae]